MKVVPTNEQFEVIKRHLDEKPIPPRREELAFAIYPSHNEQVRQVNEALLRPYHTLDMKWRSGLQVILDLFGWHHEDQVRSAVSAWEKTRQPMPSKPDSITVSGL